MKKNVISDMKTSKGHITMITRQDIVDDPKRVAVSRSNRKKEFTQKRIQSSPSVHKRTPLVHKNLFRIFLITILGACVFFTARVFEKATITVTAKQQLFTLNNEQFTASKNDASLPFEIMIVSNEELENKTLSQSQNVSIKAAGSLTFYNQYSKKPLKISAGTYVADTDGKTYKLDKTITIPGFTVDPNDKTQIISGTTSGTITAFLPGEPYNSTATDFTIPAFKGTSKITKIYAKATSPITGGALGLVYTLSPSEKTAIETIAQTTFKDDLFKKLTVQVPSGYILYPDATSFSYVAHTDIESPTADAAIPIDGTVSAIIFPQKELSDAVINHELPTITAAEHAEISLPNLSQLTFGFTDQNQLITKDMTSVAFTLSGNVTGIWNPDMAQMLSKLEGVSRTSVTSIFSSEPGIVKATVQLFPPWNSKLPYDSTKIHILSSQ